MVPQTFFGSSSREVLKRVRQSLGEDAMIVSNRAVAGGLEVTALAGRPPTAPPAARKAPGQAAAPDASLVPQLMLELKAMKNTLQRELSTIAWSDLRHRAPARASIVQSLLNAGFSPPLTRELAAMVPMGAPNGAAPKQIYAELQRRLLVESSDDVVERGGVFALIGPTGVGKTTTVAKLAARCVVRRGVDSLALLTTDSYRIGAHDQLRIYGRILNVPVHAIKDAGDMKATLAELRNKHTVLIDTTGMNQRDPMVCEQNALLAAGERIQLLLLLSATTNAATLDEVVDYYGRDGVYGCIVTKIDESASVGTVLDSVIRNRLTLHYVTNGQRVPEDVHLPNHAYLLHRALQGTLQASPSALDSEETSSMMAFEQQAAHG